MADSLRVSWSFQMSSRRELPPFPGLVPMLRDTTQYLRPHKIPGKAWDCWEQRKQGSELDLMLQDLRKLR